ncbi:MAG: hypothetical protein AAF608_04640 [Pseudomonadota bacterium]
MEPITQELGTTVVAVVSACDSHSEMTPQRTEEGKDAGERVRPDRGRLCVLFGQALGP